MARDECRRGAVLGAVLIVMLVLALLGAGLLSLSSVDALEAGRSVSAAQAFWTAEAGVEHVKAITQNVRKPFPSVPYAASPTGFLWGSNAVSGATSKGTYAVDIVDDPAWTNAGHVLKKYLIHSRGVSTGGARAVVTLHAMIPTYAMYMHASHEENGVFFGSGDRIDGPIYTDDRLNILGPPGPVFLQSVSSGSNRDPNYRQSSGVWNPTVAEKNAMFQGGMPLLNAPPLDIGGFSSDHIAEIQAEAGGGGLLLSGNYDLTFSGSGALVYSNRATHATASTSLAALTGPVYVSGDAHVRGVVNGSVTVAANDVIYIASNVTYASAMGLNSPYTNGFDIANVSDKLGLIARNGVWVQGVNTIEIHASIMITSDGFSAEEKFTDIGGKEIRMFGGITQFSRGVVGRATTPFQGFHKNYRFDTRFLTDAPPNFPYSVYMYSGWSQTSGP